jgi:integrase
LTSKALEILKTIPKYGHGYLFTTTAGVRPVGSHSKVKASLDEKIAALRKKGGEELVPHWVLHDLRRTVRTRLSDVGIDAFVAERVLGHALPGLHSVYDQSTHSQQKRRALEKWQELLLSIVEPTPATART